MLNLSPWPGMLAVLGALGLALGALRLYQLRRRPDPELVRKLLHVLMGLVALSFPWLFHEPWPVVVLALVATGLMLALQRIRTLRTHVGGVLYGVERRSYGELCYPTAVCALFLLSGGDPVRYGIPMLLLALADPAAALFGLRHGRVHYRTPDGWKSGEGSLAFFTVAVLCTALPLGWIAGPGAPEPLLLGLLAGFVVMLLEAIAWRGLDNLFVPLGGFALLATHAGLGADALALRLLMIALLCAAALLWQRRTTLRGSAACGAALVGYVTWVGGGWLWLLPPAILFFAYPLLWPAAHAGRPHTVHHVLSVSAVGLAWLGLSVLLDEPALFYPYTIAYAAPLACIGVERLLARVPFTPALAVWSSSTLKSSTLLLAPLLLAESPGPHAVLATPCTLLAVGVAAALFYRHARLFTPQPRVLPARLRRLLLVAFASTAGLLPFLSGML